MTNASIDVDATLSGVTWVSGECLPSSGSLTYEDGTYGTVTVTFLPTTPTAGTVQIQYGMFPAFETDLLTACM